MAEAAVAPAPALWLVDKPAGPTSHDIVATARRALGRKAKVGHCGTLDPFATGLLVLLVGRATRLAPYPDRPGQDLPGHAAHRFRVGDARPGGADRRARAIPPPSRRCARCSRGSSACSVSACPRCRPCASRASACTAARDAVRTSSFPSARSRSTPCGRSMTSETGRSSSRCAAGRAPTCAGWRATSVTGSGAGHTVRPCVARPWAASRSTTPSVRTTWLRAGVSTPSAGSVTCRSGACPTRRRCACCTAVEWDTTRDRATAPWRS